MDTVLIRRNGTVIDVSCDGLTGVSHTLLNILQKELTYKHVISLRGHQQYSVDGSRRTVEIRPTQLYHVVNGILMTGFGLLTRVVRALREVNCHVQYVDISAARVRPACYVEDWDNVHRNITFRPRQEECLRIISQNQCGLIDATMGFGKGELFLMLCLLYPNAKFHIVAPGKDIAEGLVRRLTRLFPNVGLIGAGKNFYGDRITVFVAKSMPKSDGDADFLLCDEAHLLAAPTHARSISFVWRHSRNFGFTGTLDMRMDNADRQLELLFGVPLFKMTYADAVSEGLVVPITVRWLPVALSNNPVANLSDPVRISRKGVWQNHERNKIIADDIRTNYSNLDTQILILCQTTDHAIYLWQHLPEFELCYGALSGDRIAKYKLQGLLPEHYTAVDGTRREQLRDGFAAGTVKRVIATDVWATGVDFVNLQVLYRIDARSSEIVDNQGPGRLSRTAANKTGAVLVDCWDSFDSRLLNKAMKRKANYKKLGWKQTNVPRASLYDATASD